MTGFNTLGDGVFYEQVKVSVLGFEHMTFRLRDFHSMTAPPSQQLRLSGSSMRHIEIRETLNMFWGILADKKCLLGDSNLPVC